MVLEEFLVMLGVDADTKKVEGFSTALTKVASVGAIVVGALKSVTLAAWAFADSYIRRAEELSNANSELYTITKDQVEMSKKYEEGMGKLGKIIESVKVKVAFGFLPTMLEMVETFNRFLDANKDLITNGILKLLDVVSKASQVINNTVKFIVKIIEATVGWKGALIGLVAILALVKRAMILAFIANPVTWIIAAIVGLMLLIDDFMTYLDGGESQFGEFWGSMLEWIDKVKPQILAIKDALIDAFNSAVPYVLAIVDSVTTSVGAIWDIFSGFFEFLSALWSGNTDDAVKALSKIWDAIVVLLGQTIDNAKAIFPILLSILKSVLDGMVNALRAFGSLALDLIKAMVTGIGNIFSTLTDLIIMPFRKAFDWITDKFSGIGSFISGAFSGAKSLVGGSASSASNNVVNSGGNLTVHAPISVTSNDPLRAGQATQTGLVNAFNSAQRNMYSRAKS